VSHLPLFCRVISSLKAHTALLFLPLCAAASFSLRDEILVSRSQAFTHLLFWTPVSLEWRRTFFLIPASGSPPWIGSSFSFSQFLERRLFLDLFFSSPPCSLVVEVNPMDVASHCFFFWRPSLCFCCFLPRVLFLGTMTPFFFRCRLVISGGTLDRKPTCVPPF